MLYAIEKAVQFKLIMLLTLFFSSFCEILPNTQTDSIRSKFSVQKNIPLPIVF